jgi:hypothetical protein
MTHEIPLTRGQVALVDAEDYERLNAFKWCATRNRVTAKWYAIRGVLVAGKSTTIKMHREILLAPTTAQIDHQNGNGLDNRRENLRIATNAQNLFNRGPQRNNSSGFKGVCFHKQAQKWKAEIAFRGQRKHLGLFTTPEDAHAAYIAAATQLHGEFAKTL